MVNPVVLENCKIDSSNFQGFAFGVGLDRITMLKHGLKILELFLVVVLIGPLRMVLA